MGTLVDLKLLERIHKALGNRRRLAILRYLKRSPGTSVGAIATHISISFNATSKHMIILAAAGFVEREQVGLNMLYRLACRLPMTAEAIVADL